MRAQSDAGRTNSTTELGNKSAARAPGSGLEQRGGASRESGRRAEEIRWPLACLLVASGIDGQGYPARLGISEMSPMNWADGGMSKHNTESTQTSCLAEHRPCCHSSAAVKPRRSTPFTLHLSASQAASRRSTVRACCSTARYHDVWEKQC